MSYIDDAALYALADKRVYFYRIDSDVWYRAVLPVNLMAHDFWQEYEEAVELQADGSGKYVRCKKLPMKEDWFYKLRDEMLLISLQAQQE
jgi:hypothetical protein